RLNLVLTYLLWPGQCVYSALLKPRLNGLLASRNRVVADRRSRVRPSERRLRSCQVGTDIRCGEHRPEWVYSRCAAMLSAGIGLMGASRMVSASAPARRGLARRKWLVGAAVFGLNVPGILIAFSGPSPSLPFVSLPTLAVAAVPPTPAILPAPTAPA